MGRVRYLFQETRLADWDGKATWQIVIEIPERVSVSGIQFSTWLGPGLLFEKPGFLEVLFGMLGADVSRAQCTCAVALLVWSTTQTTVQAQVI